MRTKSPAERRSEMMGVWLSPAEKELAEDWARRRHLNLSAAARQLLMAEINRDTQKSEVATAA